MQIPSRLTISLGLISIIPILQMYSVIFTVKYVYLCYTEQQSVKNRIIQMTSSCELSIGLMDSAYFVSKNELIRWVQDILQLDINHIEDLGTGAVYCQLIDAWHKGAVPMGKVNWRAKFDYQFMPNLKLFQQALARIGAIKKIDLMRLVKAQYQDNLEMIQWLKRFLELKGSPLEGYDPLARRGGEKLFSYHAQKNSFINRPAKPIAQKTQRREHRHDNKENIQVSKMGKIKKILDLKESAEQKIEMIKETVFARSGAKESGRKELGELKIEANESNALEEAF